MNQKKEDEFDDVKRVYAQQKAEMDKPGYDAKIKALRKDWYERARKVTLKTLSGFLAELVEYKHDYNTVVYGATAAALAAAAAFDHSPTGGITGFQAGGVFWEFYGEWLSERDKPAKILRYENMLYPQYADDFGAEISKSTWEWLQAQAKKELDKGAKSTHPNVVAHWQSIVDGVVPFGFAVSER